MFVESKTKFKVLMIITLKISVTLTMCFDTLVLDCEGAFYYILQDTPEILEGIKLLIMENDYF
jgi:hypothetical protein